jgi:hypothetical protein
MEDNSNLYLMLGRLEGKVDALLSNQTRTDEALSDHEERITSIEAMVQQKRGVWQFLGIAWGVLIALVAAFADQIQGLFR